MKVKNIKKQGICVLMALSFALCLTMILTWGKEIRVQRKMAREVFRFHVLANSDSEQDQALKMKVKESVILYMKNELSESQSVEMTKNWASTHLKEITEVAEETLRKENCTYEVKTKVENCYFPEKSYGDVTFPKGNYDALRIEIGAAKGKNWWCVLYPNLCFIDSVHAVVPEKGKKELKKVLDEEEYEMVTTTSKFKIKWFFFW